MKEITGDIWQFHLKPKSLIVIPTNGLVKADGRNVMGRGLAHQAKTKYPSLPLRLGLTLKKHGNVPHEFSDIGLITFPVKHNWWEEADPKLIIVSVDLLKAMVDWQFKDYSMYIPRVGCGNGQLDWSLVKPILAEALDDRFTAVSHPNDYK